MTRCDYTHQQTADIPAIYRVRVLERVSALGYVAEPTIVSRYACTAHLENAVTDMLQHAPRTVLVEKR